MVRLLTSLVVKRELSFAEQPETGIGNFGIELDPSVFLDLLECELNTYRAVAIELPPKDVVSVAQRSDVLDRQGHDEASVDIRLAFNE